MLSKKELKKVGNICAYCGKVLNEKKKTIDYILPIRAGGKGYPNNIVICCRKCNTKKGDLDINTFFENNKLRLQNFYNYLQIIDTQLGNNNYSQAVLRKIQNSHYTRKHKSKNAKFSKNIYDHI